MTLSIEERRKALSSRHPSWPMRSLGQQLSWAAREYGDRPSLLAGERRYTYRDVHGWSGRLAKGLIAAGVRPGEQVAMVLANYPEFVALKYAIARVGAVAVPVNFKLRADELRSVLGQSDSVLLVTMARFRGLDYLAMLDAVAPGWTKGESEELPTLRGAYVFDADGSAAGSGAPGLDELAERGASVSDGELAERERAVHADDVCDLVYTSGTTGFSKGAMLTHDNSLRCAYSSAYIRALGDANRILFSLPLYHVFAYAEGMLAATWVGGAIVPQLEFGPVATFQAIEAHRVDEALLVPTMSIALVEHPARHDHDLSSLRSVMSASAPAPVRLWEQLRAELGVREIVTAYGQTETAASSTYTMPDDALELSSETVGRAKPGDVAGVAELGGRVTKYKTVDPLTGEDLPDGEPGELAVTGPQVMRGYYGRPEETAAVFAGGWMRSGDLGVIRPDGYLVLTGRSRELYKRGAELVAPHEVEDVLTGRPDVAQAYVIGVSDDYWGEIGVAFVVAAAGADPAAEELIAHCRERLARFKVPDRVVFLAADELPKTTTGKVQKFQLAKMVPDAASSS